MVKHNYNSVVAVDLLMCFSEKTKNNYSFRILVAATCNALTCTCGDMTFLNSRKEYEIMAIHRLLSKPYLALARGGGGGGRGGGGCGK